jgi:hypothetical protein
MLHVRLGSGFATQVQVGVGLGFAVDVVGTAVLIGVDVDGVGLVGSTEKHWKQLMSYHKRGSYRLFMLAERT